MSRLLTVAAAQLGPITKGESRESTVARLCAMLREAGERGARLVMQAGAYQSGSWMVGVARAGNEENCDLIGGSCIIAPTGEIGRNAKRWPTR